MMRRLDGGSVVANVSAAVHTTVLDEFPACGDKDVVQFFICASVV